MRAVYTRPIRRDEGAVAIEFAIAAPVLFLVLFGILQFGLIFFNVMQAQNAASEGARWGSLRYPASAVVSRTIEAAPSLALSASDVVVSVEDSGTPVATDPTNVLVLNNHTVSVTVRSKTPAFLPFMGTALDDDGNGFFDFNATARRRVE